MLGHRYIYIIHCRNIFLIGLRKASISQVVEVCIFSDIYILFDMHKRVVSGSHFASPRGQFK